MIFRGFQPKPGTKKDLGDLKTAQEHTPVMGALAMLKKINPLPGAQAETMFVNGYGQAGKRQHGANVGGRIIRAFQGMPVPGLPFGNQFLHKGFHVHPGSGVIALTDDQGGAGMLHIEITHAILDIPMVDAGMDFLGEGIKTLTARGDLYNVFKPVHTRSYPELI